VGAVFDGPNLMASAGLVPVMALAERCACMIVSGRMPVPGPASRRTGSRFSSGTGGRPVVFG
jgi:hypothetical protein